MPELIAKANQAILEAQLLRKEGRSLRLEAAVRASQLGETILQSHRVEREYSIIKARLDQSLFERGGRVEAVADVAGG
jgi:hypothetical protein